MMCREPNPDAFTKLPDAYHVRNCRQDELDILKRMPFDTTNDVDAYVGYMDEFYDRVYAPQPGLFYNRCLFVYDGDDVPIGTGFILKSYDTFNAIHWLKVVREHEGRGIGRALLSIILGALKTDDFPVYLHTQPESDRAIKLYSDFGFCLLTDSVIGCRPNHLHKGLDTLRRTTPRADFVRLRTVPAPPQFL